MNFAFQCISSVFTLCQLWRPSYGNAFKSCMRPCFFVSLMLGVSCWVFVDRHRQWQGQPLNLGTITFHFAALVSVLTLVPCSVSNRGPIRGMDGGKKQTLCIRLTFYIIYISGFPTQTLLYIHLGMSWPARKLETLTS